ncbi:MAG: 4Fe-4S binding protein [Candidatus Delongbacteria bacterium]|jgi:NosR/NirI family nitrous oxide reductase transcriptional regulator|nr:4Fe-4S binding protein [Candidatus Delongbacteria bacterium]
MKKYLLKIPVIIAFIVVFLLAKEEVSEKFDFEANKNLINLVKEKIPAASSIEQVNYPTTWSKIFDQDENQVGNFILSSPFCDEIRGYAGNVPFIIIADEETKILGLGLLNNRETPAWITGLQNVKFFESWNGKKIEEIKDHKVDTVSGATFTSRAVIKMIDKRMSILTGQTEYISGEKKSTKIVFLDHNISIVLYLILLLSIIAIFVKKLNKYKYIIQILSIIFFGIISGQSISMYLLESLSIQGLSIFTTYVTLFMLGFAVLIPLVFNRHLHCHYICPFGNIQTLLGKLPIKKIKLSGKVIKTLRKIRLLTFVSIVIIVSTTLKINLSKIEPFTIFVFSSATMTTIIASAVIFVTSLFIKKPWCLYLCPTGQFFDLLKDGIPFRKGSTS